MRFAQLFYLCLALSPFLSLAGCGARLASVTGPLVFPATTPCTGGTVVFSPADGNVLAAQGRIQADGTFRLGTTRPGEGVLPGKYRVNIEPDDESAGKLAISERELTVVAGSNDFTIT